MLPPPARRGFDGPLLASWEGGGFGGVVLFTGCGDGSGARISGGSTEGLFDGAENALGEDGSTMVIGTRRLCGFGRDFSNG